MPGVRENWTDSRLDDLNKRVSEGFGEVNRRLDRVDERFDAMYRQQAQVGAVIVAALIGLIATQF